MTLREALSRTELRDGALWGLTTSGVVAAGALLAAGSGRRPRSWPAAGTAGLAAALLALHLGAGVPGLVLAALVLLALGGLPHLPWRLVGQVPGALLLASQIPAGLPAWAAPLVALAAVAVAVAGPEVDACYRAGVGPAMMAAAAVGAWACVPDVEHVAPVAAAFTIVAVGSVWPPLRLGRPFFGPTAGLVLWAAAAGSVNRPASLVGAAAGLGLFIVAPLAFRTRVVAGWAPAIALVAGQAALVVLTSRVAGLRDVVVEAAAISAGSLVAAAVVMALAARGPDPAGAQDEPSAEPIQPGTSQV